MSGSSIKGALTEATAYIAAHPEEARYRDRPATATLRGGLVVDVSGAGGEQVTTDMVAAVGGTGSAPSPGWLLRAATASCVATLLAMRAASLDVSLEALSVTVDSESDDRGILDIDPSVPAGPLSTRVAVSVRAPGISEERIRELVDWAVTHGPVTDALVRVVPMEVELTV
jgi:uncharacterized OsmC-like protein